MSKWSFDPNEEGKPIKNGEDVIMYPDNINLQVIAKVVEIQNENSDGDFMTAISSYLDNEIQVEQDQREFIMEQLKAYHELSNPGQQNTGTQQPVVHSGGNVVNPNPTPTKNPPATGNPKRRTAQSNAPKKASTGDAIKLLQEKINLLQILDGAEVIDIPTGLSKDARDIMTEFQKDQDALIQKYIERIQKM